MINYMEAVAETSDDFMERYFNGDEFSVEEIRSAMRTSFRSYGRRYRCTFFPVPANRDLISPVEVSELFAGDIRHREVDNNKDRRHPLHKEYSDHIRKDGILSAV